jgi:protein-arginine kinase activator protein McsA
MWGCCIADVCDDVFDFISIKARRMSCKLSKHDSYSTDDDSETYFARPLQQIVDEVTAGSHAGKAKVANEQQTLIDVKNEVIRAKDDLIAILRSNNDALQLTVKKLQRPGPHE